VSSVLTFRLEPNFFHLAEAGQDTSGVRRTDCENFQAIGMKLLAGDTQ
jgi:hypothetical protein